MNNALWCSGSTVPWPWVFLEAVPEALSWSHSSCCPDLLGSWLLSKPSSQSSCGVCLLPGILPTTCLLLGLAWARFCGLPLSLWKEYWRMKPGTGSGEHLHRVSSRWMMLRRLHMILSHSCHGNFGNFLWAQSHVWFCQGIWGPKVLSDEHFQFSYSFSPTHSVVTKSWPCYYISWVSISIYQPDSFRSFLLISTSRPGYLDLVHTSRTLFFPPSAELHFLNLFFPLWYVASAGESWVQNTSSNLNKKG